MSMPLTIALLVLSVAVSILARFMSNRPVQPGRARLVPWNVILIFAGAFAILMVAHLVNLAGIETGRGLLR